MKESLRSIIENAKYNIKFYIKYYLNEFFNVRWGRIQDDQSVYDLPFDPEEYHIVVNKVCIDGVTLYAASIYDSRISIDIFYGKTYQEVIDKALSEIERMFRIYSIDGREDEFPLPGSHFLND